jgi:hypothetical protein
MNKQIILSAILSAIVVTSLIVIVSPTLVLAKKARSAEYQQGFADGAAADENLHRASGLTTNHPSDVQCPAL